MKTATASPRSGRKTQSRGMDLGYACFQEKYYRVCIARAAVNECVCDDSYAEHVRFAVAISTPFRTYPLSLQGSSPMQQVAAYLYISVMVSYYVTFVVTFYGDFFGEPNSSPHNQWRIYKLACKAA